MPVPMQNVVELLARAGVEADRAALVRQVGVLLSDEMLEQIARADYGHDATPNFKTLRFIRDAQAPAKVPWEQREVLELVRWSRPETEASPEAQLRAHTMRLFACAVLVRDGDPLGGAEIQTLAPLLESLLVLEKKNLLHAGAGLLLSRLAEPTAGTEGRPFFAFGLLLLARELRADDWQTLGSWVVAEESASRASAHFSETWLLGVTSFDMRHDVWRRLGERLLGEPPLVLPALREW